MASSSGGRAPLGGAAPSAHGPGAAVAVPAPSAPLPAAAGSATAGRARRSTWLAVLARLGEVAAEVGEPVLDLADRLRAEVLDGQQFPLGTRREVVHGVDALAAQAVVGTHRQVQLLERSRASGG